MSYLNQIIQFHRDRASADERPIEELLSQVDELATPASFQQSIRVQNEAGNIGVIAEIKRGSPSKGKFTSSLAASSLNAWAQLYVDGGATCFSVLTDTEHFYGSMNDLQVASQFGTPCLRKDFTVSERDVIDARLAGASAVLLIASALSVGELERFSSLAHNLEMSCLYEIHEPSELDKLSNCRVEMVGVNQRDLKTFEVDSERALRTLEALDDSWLSVAESGISGPDAAQELARAGFNAILVGETIVTSSDPGRMLSQLASVEF